MARPRTPTRTSSGQPRPSRARTERVRKQTVALEGRLGREKARARLGTTERQIGWKRSLARAEERLRRARSTDDPALADKLNKEAAELIAESTRLRNKPTANLIERASRINEWRRNTRKLLPSKSAIAFCEEHGRWCLNADGTATGEAHFDVPRANRDSFESFKAWFKNLQSRYKWLDQEPLYFAIGFTVGGDLLRSSRDRARYDKIRGSSALIGNWRLSLELGGERGYPYMVSAWLNQVAKNTYEKGLRITTVSFFLHYGPTPPLSEGEFNCELPTLGSLMVPPPMRIAPEAEPKPKKPKAKPEKPTAKPEKPGKPTKKPAQKTPKVVRMFVVYDENGKKYLNRPAYSGRVPGVWGPLKAAHFFETRAKAQSAASNLNASRPPNRKYRAVVWPVDVTETS